jgi:hypothetical protein
MDTLGIVVILFAAVAGVAVTGYAIGILIARRLDRWAATDDEEPRGDPGLDA